MDVPLHAALQLAHLVMIMVLNRATAFFTAVCQSL